MWRIAYGLGVATGVLFDVDGVLIDSAAMYTATWTAWAQPRAIDPAALEAELELAVLADLLGCVSDLSAVADRLDVLMSG